MLKHVLLLIPRLIMEWARTIYSLATIVPEPKDNIVGFEGASEAVFYGIHGLSDITTHSLMIYQKTYATIENVNALINMLQQGKLSRVYINGYEDGAETYTKQPHCLDLAGPALLMTNQDFRALGDLLALNLEIVMEYHADKVLHLSTDEALCKAAFYLTAGKGLVYPKEVYKKIVRVYMINFLLKPIYSDIRAVIALKVLSENTDSKLFKILHKINNKLRPFDKALEYHEIA